jgi:hypothetical protein
VSYAIVVWCAEERGSAIIPSPKILQRTSCAFNILCESILYHFGRKTARFRSLGLAGSTPQLIIQAGRQLLFSADNGTQGIELWTSDGTAGAALSI